MKRPTLGQYRKAAKMLYHSEGEIEIDDDAKVSRGSDEGAYVQAWVWVEESQAVVAPVKDRRR